MKRLTLKKLNNDGAALILAILVVTFISIIASLLLYLSAKNYEMKTTDYNTKVSFYGAEIPLEELRMQMAVDVSVASENAYRKVMQQYSYLTDGDLRKAEYQKVFCEEIEKIWSDRRGATNNWKAAIKLALNNKSDYDIILNEDDTPDNTKSYHIILLKTPETPVNLSANDTDTDYQLYQQDKDIEISPGVTETQRRIILQNIKVTYTAPNGFTSEILTDLCIVPPEIDWTVSKAENTSGITSADTDRTRIIFEECVTYLDWQKQ